MFVTNLSGNEIYCLHQKQYHPSNIVFGNSIYPLGFIESLGKTSRLPLGTEIDDATKALAVGRTMAHERALQQAKMQCGHGLINLTNQLLPYAGCVEVIATGTLINSDSNVSNSFFSSPANGKELYTLLDAGYIPLSLTFGNIVHATGIAMGIFKDLKGLARGEVRAFSDSINQTRHQALARLITNAKQHHANAIIGIKTFFSPVGDACEMTLIGTASNHPRTVVDNEIITSNLTALETWNLAKTGYVPMQLLMSSVVFSMGLTTNIKSSLKAFFKGENNELSTMVSNCRNKVIEALHQQANTLAASCVVGTRMYIFSWGNGLIEIFAVATAVKKLPDITTSSDQLIPQAMIIESNKLFNDVDIAFNEKSNTPISALFRIVLIVIIVLALIWLALSK